MGEEVGALPDFLFSSFFPVQQTTSGIGHRVKYGSFFGLVTNTLIMRKTMKRLCIICSL